MNATQAGPICEELERLEAQGADLEELLILTVELLHDSNARFDWTGIYRLDSEETLRLGPFIGDPTEHVTISIGQGVCGTAVAKKCTMNIPDVTKATNYLACSARTRSELVVLIRDRDRIHAQIDIDSHEPDAFDDETVAEVERVSNWLAGAYARYAGAAVVS